MKKVCVVKRNGAEASEACEAVLTELRNYSLKELLFCDCFEEISPDADKVLAFGGDGTVLALAGYLAEHDIGAAILGVNLGNLGFLTAFERDVSVRDIFDALMSEDVFERPFIEASTVSRLGYALNDAVIKADGNHPILLELEADGTFVDEYHGDGLIVSTATGSTAYSLSAGGPVLVPTLDALVVNPICPHSLHSRPLIVGGDCTLTIRARGASGARISLDGRSSVALTCGGAPLTLKKSSKTAKFVDVKQDFFKKLLCKMNRWGSTL